MTDTITTDQNSSADPVPIVGYLSLADPHHLVAITCSRCGATYFDQRDACASCFESEFTSTAVPTTGTLETFTVVEVAAPGIAVPYVAGVVNCGGISVRANVVNVEPKVGPIHFGMPLRLTTFPIGIDDEGRTAMGFGFEPARVGKDAR